MENIVGAFITVISGVLVYVFSELFSEFILKPIRSYKELRGRIAKHLVLYANLFSNPLKIKQDSPDFADYISASNSTRELAAEVAAFAEMRPVSFGLIPSKIVLKEVSKDLIGISNGYISNGDVFELGCHNVTHSLNIKKALKIEKTPGRSK